MIKNKNNLTTFVVFIQKRQKLNDLSDFNFILRVQFQLIKQSRLYLKKVFFQNVFEKKKSQNIGRFSGLKLFSKEKI